MQRPFSFRTTHRASLAPNVSRRLSCISLKITPKLHTTYLHRNPQSAANALRRAHKRERERATNEMPVRSDCRDFRGEIPQPAMQSHVPPDRRDASRARQSAVRRPSAQATPEEISLALRPKKLPVRRLRARRPCRRYLLLAGRELQGQSGQPANLPDLRPLARARQDLHDPDPGRIYGVQHRPRRLMRSLTICSKLDADFRTVTAIAMTVLFVVNIPPA